MNIKINLRGSYLAAGFSVILGFLTWQTASASNGESAYNWLYDKPEWLLAFVLAAIFAGLSLLTLAAYPRWQEINKSKPKVFYSTALSGAVLGVVIALLIAGAWKDYLSNLAPPSLVGTSANLTWNASTSPAVGGYIIYYGQSSGNYTANVDVGNITAYTVQGLQQGSTYYFAAKAYDSAKTTQSSYSNEVSFTVPVTTVLTADYTANITSGLAGMSVIFTPNTTGTVTSWTWGLPGSYTPSITNTTAQAVNATYPTAGSYSVSLTATGPSGSVTKTYPNLITVAAPTAAPATTTPPVVALPPTQPVSVTSLVGLVAAYGFEEVSGTAVADASGMANHGTISNAVRIATGHSGKALQFNGTNAWATVNDSATLDLSTGMTLEAWVYPNSLSSKSVIIKEQPGDLAYGLYANENVSLPISYIKTQNYNTAQGKNPLPLNQWSHVVTTYNGQYQQLYINGVMIAQSPLGSLIPQTTGVLRIGGNSIWGEYFNGYIDEVRIYNRALTLAEVSYNLATAISISNPPVFVMGDKTQEPWVDIKAQGIAQAYQVTPPKTAIVNTVQVYLDASSTATEIVAGIYKDSNNHPGTLIAQGKLSALKSGTWNSVPIPIAAVTANQHYWIAILGSKGQIGFLDRIGSGTSLVETSASSKLTTLPSTWTRSAQKANSDMSVFGLGY